MNAYDDLFEIVTEYPYTLPAEAVKELLDAHQAEVLHEAAGAVASDRDSHVPSGGKGAYRRGMNRAIEVLRHRADNTTAARHQTNTTQGDS